MCILCWWYVDIHKEGRGTGSCGQGREIKNLDFLVDVINGCRGVQCRPSPQTNDAYCMFPHYSPKIYKFPLIFGKFIDFPPIFVQFRFFCIINGFCFLLFWQWCIMLYMYWTPLNGWEHWIHFFINWKIWKLDWWKYHSIIGSWLNMIYKDCIFCQRTYGSEVWRSVHVVLLNSSGCLWLHGLGSYVRTYLQEHAKEMFRSLILNISF